MQRREAGQLNQVVYRRRPHPGPTPCCPAAPQSMSAARIVRRPPPTSVACPDLRTATAPPARSATSERSSSRPQKLWVDHALAPFTRRVPVAIAEPDSYPNAHAFTASLAWPKPDARDINDADSAASAKSAAFTDADAGIADAGLPGARRRQPPRPRRQRRP